MKKSFFLKATAIIMGAFVLVCAGLSAVVLLTPKTYPNPTEIANLSKAESIVLSTSTLQSITSTIAPTATTLPTRTAIPSLTPIPTAAGTPIFALASCIPHDSPRERGLVVKIVDGDTIEVAIGNALKTVRYIGMNTPEWNQVGGSQATAFNTQLVRDRYVTLVKDISETDKFDRILRYVFVDDTFVNLELVSQGYAEAASYPPDTSCDGIFRNAQDSAQSRRSGIWSSGAFASMTETSMPVFQPTVPVSAGTCNCTGPDLDCANFVSRSAAQACFNYCNLLHGDVFSLDSDGDGKVCETMP